MAQQQVKDPAKFADKFTTGAVGVDANSFDGAKVPDSLLHERFCLPMQGETEPRVERFISYRDVDGHSIPIPTVRCIECGTFRLIEPNQGRM